MLKFLPPSLATVTVISTYAATSDLVATAVLGVSVLTGSGLAVWKRSQRAASEATSTPMPTFLPSSLPKWDACPPESQEELGEITDEDGDVLPPIPNLGQHNKPYRGPDYVGKGLGDTSRYRKD